MCSAATTGKLSPRKWNSHFGIYHVPSTTLGWTPTFLPLHCTQGPTSCGFTTQQTTPWQSQVTSPRFIYLFILHTSQEHLLSHGHWRSRHSRGSKKHTAVPAPSGPWRPVDNRTGEGRIQAGSESPHSIHHRTTQPLFPVLLLLPHKSHDTWVTLDLKCLNALIAACTARPATLQVLEGGTSTSSVRGSTRAPGTVPRVQQGLCLRSLNSYPRLYLSLHNTGFQLHSNQRMSSLHRLACRPPACLHATSAVRSIRQGKGGPAL